MSFNLFNSIRINKPKRNAFDLSHDVKLSMNMGDLIPIFCEPVVPGDTFKVNTEILMRFAPLQAPVMHQMNVYTHFFFVPNRLIWDGWKDFITGGKRKGKEILDPPQYPYFEITPTSYGALGNKLLRGSLADYLGFPVGNDQKEFEKLFVTGSSLTNPENNVKLDLLPFRAYHLIWNEYYRDQNLSEEFDIRKEIPTVINGDYIRQLFSLRTRAWEKDYFTSALPWPQAGEDVVIPMKGEIDLTELEPFHVEVNGVSGNLVTSKENLQVDTRVVDAGGVRANGITTNNTSDLRVLLGTAERTQDTLPLNGVTQATINELRRAIKAQEFLELSARGGGRYIEQIMSFFGVKSSDARLQRPEYLGGGKSPVVISDTQQTSQTTNGEDGSPQGTLSGQAVSVQRSHSFKRFFEEHGYVIGIMSVLPRSAYQQGLPRKFTKFEREDYYWPQFAHLGEQEIKNSELYCSTSDNSNGGNSGTFGYTPRYAEYKYIPSRVCGDFRDTLAFWHMGRIFNGRPHLNENFVTFKGDNRIFADKLDTTNKLWVNIHHNISALRPMPVYGTPFM